MKFLVVVAAIVVCASSAAVNSLDKDAPIVKYSFVESPEGGFQYNYETGNGIAAEASGVVKNPNSEDASLGIQGAYKYTAPDGTPVQITYTADENGFQPQGNLLPVPPPVPEAILRSLEYIAAHPPPVDKAYSKPSTTVYG